VLDEAIQLPAGSAERERAMQDAERAFTQAQAVAAGATANIEWTDPAACPGCGAHALMPRDGVNAKATADELFCVECDHTFRGSTEEVAHARRAEAARVQMIAAFYGLKRK
jgi:hypothetical protein